ncbi:MAG: magnesium transporter [Parcubacteria group bacterium Athens0714_24]|nr:MAG: magnesium transporter [Parcubacteria group bacterium Athens0714_24]
MLSTYKHKNLTWVDLEDPTADEVKSLMQKYYIHPAVAEELLKPTIRPRVDAYKNFIYLILHFPIFDNNKKTSISYEVDFVMGKNFLIAAHYKEISLFHEITKLFEVGSILGEEQLVKNSGVLSTFIIKQLYEFALRQLDHIQLKINDIEENIFKGHEKEMVAYISYLRRDTLDFQRAIHSHESILNSFKIIGEKFFNKDFVHYANVILGNLDRVKTLMENCVATIESLHNTNDSLLTDKVNDIMRTLTIVSFITFPLMLFAALFGMSNLISTPIVGMKGDFWIITGIMFVSASSLLFFFKRRKWI